MFFFTKSSTFFENWHKKCKMPYVFYLILIYHEKNTIKGGMSKTHPLLFLVR